jgi:hypothetical protein
MRTLSWPAWWRASSADAPAAFDVGRAAGQSWREGPTIAGHAQRTDGVRSTVKQESQ